MTVLTAVHHKVENAEAEELAAALSYASWTMRDFNQTFCLLPWVGPSTTWSTNELCKLIQEAAATIPDFIN